MSIFSEATFIAQKAASITASGLPTNVITVLFVAFPGSIFNKVTPLLLLIASAIESKICLSLPSEKFGTHSISLLIDDKINFYLSYTLPLLQINEGFIFP